MGTEKETVRESVRVGVPSAIDERLVRLDSVDVAPGNIVEGENVGSDGDDCVVFGIRPRQISTHAPFLVELPHGVLGHRRRVGVPVNCLVA